MQKIIMKYKVGKGCMKTKFNMNMNQTYFQPVIHRVAFLPDNPTLSGIITTR